MIMHAGYRNHVSHVVEREASPLLGEDHVDREPDDDLDDDTAEICRMIELSGMIGMECGLLGDE
jgi:hypothetical protein